jgi:hypothetical protein
MQPKTSRSVIETTYCGIQDLIHVGNVHTFLGVSSGSTPFTNLWHDPCLFILNLEVNYNNNAPLQRSNVLCAALACLVWSHKVVMLNRPTAIFICIVRRVTNMAGMWGHLDVSYRRRNTIAQKFRLYMLNFNACIQDLASSFFSLKTLNLGRLYFNLLFKDLKIKIYRFIITYVALLGFETWCLTSEWRTLLAVK